MHSVKRYLLKSLNLNIISSWHSRVFIAVLMSVNCGTCTCNNTKCLLFFLPANLFVPEPAHPSDASPAAAVSTLSQHH